MVKSLISDNIIKLGQITIIKQIQVTISVTLENLSIQIDVKIKYTRIFALYQCRPGAKILPSRCHYIFTLVDKFLDTIIAL